MTELFGDKLKRLRIENGLTIYQVANRIDRSRTTVTAYETGKCLPPANIIMKLADIYGVSTDYLLNINERMSLDIEIENLTSEQRQILLEINRLAVKFFRSKKK